MAFETAGLISQSWKRWDGATVADNCRDENCGTRAQHISSIDIVEGSMDGKMSENCKDRRQGLDW